MTPRSLFTASYGVLILAMVALLVNFDAIPDPVPVHFDASGTADRWAPKTVRTVLTMPVVGLVIVGLIDLFSSPIEAATTPAQPTRTSTPPADPERSLEVPFSEALAGRIRYVAARLRSGMGMLSLVVAVGLAGWAITSMFPALSDWTWLSMLVLLIGTIGASIAMVIRLLMAVDKSKELIPDDEALTQRKALNLGRRDQLYRGGIFYNNPSDPHQVVFSRQGESNIDFNYAHAPGRRAAVAMPVLVVLVVGAIILAL